MAYPRAGKDYPRSLGEFQAWFRTDADCLDYPDGAPGRCRPRRRGHARIRRASISRRRDAPGGLGPFKWRPPN